VAEISGAAPFLPATKWFYGRCVSFPALSRRPQPVQRASRPGLPPFRCRLPCFRPALRPSRPGKSLFRPWQHPFPSCMSAFPGLREALYGWRIPPATRRRRSIKRVVTLTSTCVASREVSHRGSPPRRGWGALTSMPGMILGITALFSIRRKFGILVSQGRTHPSPLRGEDAVRALSLAKGKDRVHCIPLPPCLCASPHALCPPHPRGEPPNFPPLRLLSP
jgi:hypothetical protein